MRRLVIAAGVAAARAPAPVSYKQKTLPTKG
jgi:hypothetical protein